MIIRKAREKDIEQLDKLLFQVNMLHHNGRPDLFKYGERKYTNEQLKEIIKDDSRPVLVAADEQDKILGYAFCIFIQHKNDNILTDIKTLYIDDLCVDEALRGRHIGKILWSCNESAMRFYEKCGLKPYKVGMEKIL